MTHKMSSMLAQLTPIQWQLLTDEERGILKFTDWYTAKLGLTAPSFSACRIGLQMLEVVICRMETGNHIDDFMAEAACPAKELPEVWEAYQAYRGVARPVDQIIAVLQKFNERYVETLCKMFCFHPDDLRQTGVAEVRRDNKNANL